MSPRTDAAGTSMTSRTSRGAGSAPDTGSGHSFTRPAGAASGAVGRAAACLADTVTAADRTDLPLPGHHRAALSKAASVSYSVVRNHRDRARRVMNHRVSDGSEMMWANGSSTSHNDNVSAPGLIDEHLIGMPHDDRGVDLHLWELLGPSLKRSFQRRALALLQPNPLLGAHRHEMVKREDRQSRRANDAEAGPSGLCCVEGEVNQVVGLILGIEAQHHDRSMDGLPDTTPLGLLRLSNDDHRPFRVSSQVQTQAPKNEAPQTPERSRTEYQHFSTGRLTEKHLARISLQLDRQDVQLTVDHVPTSLFRDQPGRPVPRRGGRDRYCLS